MAIDKTGNFLRAIDKYAKKEQSEILEEIKKIEAAELKKSDETIVEDARNMIANEILAMRNRISIEVSHKEAEERKKLSDYRNKIINSVFNQCKENLIKFTNTESYGEKIKQYCKKIAKIFEDDYVEIQIRPVDLKFTDLIKNEFNKNCGVFFNKEIKIGGIIGYCAKRNMLIDETFDSNLLAWEEWFLNEYGRELL